MTMILTGSVCVPVEPVPGKKNWYQIISGEGWHRNLMHGAEEYWSDCGDSGIVGAKILGIHDDEELTEHDPRFNWEEDADNPSCCVIQWDDKYVMVLNVNLPEYRLLRFLVPYEPGAYNSRDEEDADDRPMRVEAKAKAKPVLKAATKTKAKAAPKATAKAAPKAKPAPMAKPKATKKGSK